jgi:hypothetical protein
VAIGVNSSLPGNFWELRPTNSGEISDVNKSAIRSDVYLYNPRRGLLYLVPARPREQTDGNRDPS